MEDLILVAKAHIPHFNKAIELNPRDAALYKNRGYAFIVLGQYDKAIADFNKAIELNPMLAWAYLFRGDAYAGLGQYDKAIADFDKVIEMKPSDATAYYLKARILAMCRDAKYRDGSKAIKLAKKALKLYLEADVLDIESDVLDTLAAAYAEASKFEDAIATQEKAIDSLKKEGGPNLDMDIYSKIDQYIEHLKLYKANKPRREK